MSDRRSVVYSRSTQQGLTQLPRHLNAVARVVFAPEAATLRRLIKHDHFDTLCFKCTGHLQARNARSNHSDTLYMSEVVAR